MFMSGAIFSLALKHLNIALSIIPLYILIDIYILEIYLALLYMHFNIFSLAL